jgi:hypothetical protein
MGNNVAIFIILCSSIIVSCNKGKNHKESGTFSGSANDFTDLHKYEIREKVINDSAIRIEGKNQEYIITGFLDKRTHKKINWWVISDVRDSTNKLKIQYIPIDDKPFANQILSYQKGKLDTLSSKFYRVKNIGDSIHYSFYLPKRNNPVLLSEFRYLKDDKEFIIDCKKNSHYECVVKNNNKTIRGLFTEALINSKEKRTDISYIYTKDTIKWK